LALRPRPALARIQAETANEARPLGTEEHEDGGREQRHEHPAHVVILALRPRCLNRTAHPADRWGMQSLLVVSAVFATLFQGMLVAAKRLPPACARCGLRFERR